MCTVFAFNKNNSILVAKNYDNFIKNGMIFTNRRGMRKHSLAMPTEKTLSWISVYGSVTFSQCGKGMPVNGMNEKGLVVEQATLPGTLYPEADNRPEISCLEAIQYILDTCANTADALQAFANFRISRKSWILHYLIADAKGEMAIVEFIDGEMVVYTKDQITEPVITNTGYKAAVNNRSLPKNETGDEYQNNSIERFNRVAGDLKGRESLSVPDSFDVLHNAQREDTVWRCVYDIAAGAVYFTSIYNKNVLKIDMNEWDLSETGQSVLYNIESTGKDFSFGPYSRAENRRNIEGFFRNEIIIKLMNLPGADFIINAYDDHITQIEMGG